MDKITQEAYFRQRVLKYAAEHGITASANRNRISRKTVHKWKKRYDGTIESQKVNFQSEYHCGVYFGNSLQQVWLHHLIDQY